MFNGIDNYLHPTASASDRAAVAFHDRLLNFRCITKCNVEITREVGGFDSCFSGLFSVFVKRGIWIFSIASKMNSKRSRHAPLA